MKQTLIVHWLLAKIYPVEYVQKYIGIINAAAFKNLPISPRDFFNYVYLREEKVFFKRRKYKDLYQYYAKIRETLPPIWSGRAKHLIFCETPWFDDFLERVGQRGHFDFSLLDSAYEEFKSYRFLSENILGMTITQNLEKLNEIEVMRPVLYEKDKQILKLRNQLAVTRFRRKISDCRRTKSVE